MSQKRIKRFWWLPVWNLEETASWLTEMSSQGWHLEHVGPLFATFVQGPAKDLRYRCQVGGEGKEERINLFAQAGWQYVGAIARQSLEIYRAEGQWPELHTDPQEQAFSLKPLQNKLFLSGGISLAGFAAQGWLIFELLRSPGMLTRMLLGEGTHVMLFFFVGLGIMGFYHLSGLQQLQRLLNTLKTGGDLNYQRPWQGVLRRERALGIAVCSLLILAMIISPVYQTIVMASSRQAPIPLGDLPVLRLERILPASEIIFDSPSSNHHYRQKRSLLVPAQHFLNQSGYVLDADGGKGRISLHSVGYRALTPELALFLGERLMGDDREFNEMYWGLTAQEHPDFDLLYTSSRQQNTQYIIAVRGRWVYRIRYSGEFPPDLVSLLAGK